MSQENVEVARQVWRAYNNQGLEAALDYFAGDIVCEDFPELPDRATYEGKEGFRERYRHFTEIWGDFVMKPVEFIDAGDDVVVAVIAMTGRGMGSDAPMDAAAVFVYEIRDGKIARDRPFTSRSQALEAAGLSE
jgi:ketosteroid isomerase-like protein